MTTSTARSFRIVTARELASRTPRPRVIDVREPDEFVGELGHVPGAELVPLATVLDVAKDWDKGETLVIACRSGARSGRAAQALVDLGFEDVANLEGGMIAYNEAGLLVDRR